MAPSNAVFWRSDAFRLAAAVVAVAGLTSCRYWFHLTNPTIAALGYLTIVLLTATVSSLKVAIVISAVADLCLNYFFMPPVGTFTITDPQNWVALFTFLGVSVVASNLSTAARDRANEAIARQDELGRLFDLSRDVLLTTDSRDAISQLAKSVSRRFHLDFVAICLPRGADWELYEGGTQSVALDRPQLSLAFAGAAAALEFDARARTYAGHRSIVSDGRSVRLVPLRFGTKAIGLLSTEGRPVEAGTLDALAGIVAIAIERAQFLEERKAAELARQSEELKSALLASLGHDLKTPLTAIGVAATNLKPAWLGEVDRQEQTDLILTEVDRLSRLFQNILEMARIDAGGIAADVRWVHPAEIFEAARDQVEHTLRQRHIDFKSHADQLVCLDPRLTASALAHVLENAAHYTSPDTSIDVEMSVSSDGLTTCVRDHGPGIAPADLPHLFNRFYRGTAAGKRMSGTGMGLSIARGVLAAERGRVWAENCPDGGAQFTIVVPADTKAATAVDHV
jgi:two-component system, OmpR family, sensor histidine kinase KdpD